MGNTYVKNGTPKGNEHLCKNCSWGQIVTGYRESEVLAFCTNISPSFRLPFPVHKCTEFEDKSRPDWDQMQKLAIQIDPVRISKKVRGFTHSNPLQPEKPENEPAIPETEDDEDENELVDAVATTTSARDC